THAQAHGRDHDPVPGLVGVLGFVRADFAAPSVRDQRRDFLLVAPVAVLELHARGVAACVSTPFLLGEAALHLSGADDDEIRLAYFDTLRLRASVELVVADAFAVLQPRHAAKARDVEQHAAAVHLVLRMLDAEYTKPFARVDLARVVAVVG